MGRLEIWRGLEAFAGARGGNVAIIFAAVMIPVSGIAAAAIDFGRAGGVRSTLQMATSAAAQAGSAHLDEDRNIIEQHVRVMLAANLPPHLAALPHRMTIPADRSSLEVVMETTVPTTLMGVLGVSELEVEATGFSKRPRPVPTADPLVAAGTSQPEAQAIASRALGGLLGSARAPVPAAGSFGAAAGPLSTMPPAAPSQAQLEQVVRDMTEQLRTLQSQSGPAAPAGLPPEAAVEVERLLREFRGLRR